MTLKWGQKSSIPVQIVESIIVKRFKDFTLNILTNNNYVSDWHHSLKKGVKNPPQVDVRMDETCNNDKLNSRLL